MIRQSFARPFVHPYTLGALLLVALLVLAGCGRSRTPEEEAAILPTATLVPTLVPAEPAATPEPEATEPSAEVTTTELVTETAEVTESEGVTESEEVTTTEAVTATEEVTEAAEITETEEITAAETVSESVHAGHEMTETTELSPTAEVSPTAKVAASAISTRFLQPTTNAIVPITFTVVMSATGVTIAPDTETREDTGHFHILIDSDFIPVGEVIPTDDLHLDYSDGSTSAVLSLTPGSHILRLQYANNQHKALGGDMFRDEIIVNVVDGAAEEAVRIVTPTEGAIVPPTFDVVMAATGLQVEPAGVVHNNAGHFHLLIDEPYIAAGEVIPMDDTHLHFGKAQLTTTLTLEPGTYLIRLQLADGTHHALAGEQYRAETTVTVEEGAPAQQVMFVKPSDEALVTSPFVVSWAASGLIIETAGKSIRPEAGHLHLLINQDFVAAGDVIPMDETHLHFGRGQTSTELTLEPGEYTLRLQMANGAHIAQDGPQYQDEMTVTVR